MSKADMTDLHQRVSLLEEEAKGERSVSRHMLRKITDHELILMDLKKEVGEMRSELAVLRADLPRIIAASIAPFFRNDR